MVEVLKSTSPLARSLAAQGLFDAEPFTLLDVGCGGGIDAIWRDFGTSLIAHGFDPSRTEIDRLRASETSPTVNYHCRYVGLRPDHPYAEQRAAEKAAAPFVNPWFRLSLYPWRQPDPIAVPGQGPPEPPGVAQFADPVDFVGVTEFVREIGLRSVDFLKIDVDGADIEVLKSAEEMLADTRVLGVGVEVTYFGAGHETANTFGNLDRMLRAAGFALYPFSVRRYSRAALPAPFVYNFPAQTTFGQPYQGDAVYLRDLAGSHPFRITAADYSPRKLLKLICLFEIAGLPDCAAEVIHTYREFITPFVDPDRLLDLLVPTLHGERVTYKEHMRRFDEQPAYFFPSYRPPS